MAGCGDVALINESSFSDSAIPVALAALAAAAAAAVGVSNIVVLQEGENLLLRRTAPGRRLHLVFGHDR